VNSGLSLPLFLSAAFLLASSWLQPGEGTRMSRPVPAGEQQPQGARIFDVRSFGAAGDGKSLDVAPINRAIEAASTAGGGTVRFPAGRYLSSSIRLRSNVGLYLEHGAVLEAVPWTQAAYDPPEPNAWAKYQDFGHSHWHNSLIWGEDVDNVSIAGPGLIYGKGLSRGLESGTYRDPPEGAGNKAISLKNCRNVTLRDISILHGGHFAILATGADNLTIDNLRIDTNRDGVDIDCCHNVRISNCSVNSPWDDGICLKSSYGLGRLRGTENVTIVNCYVTGGYIEGTLLDGTFRRAPPGYAGYTGRIKFGTESNGGFKNIAISNCIFEDCGGLAIETVDGGVIEDVTIDNIAMRNIVNSPIFIRLGNRARGPEEPLPGFIRRINISNIVVSGALTGLVYGLAALGLSVIFGVVRVVNFAHGEMMVMGMYGAAMLFAALGLDPLLSAPIVGAVMFVFGWGLQRGLINKFVERSEHQQFILLLGVATILVNALLMIFGPDARSVSVDYALDAVEVGPLLLDKARLYAGSAAIVAAAGLFAFFRFTRIGKSIRACADKPLGARVVGLNIDGLFALTFGVGAAVAGFSGALLTLLFRLRILRLPARFRSKGD